MKKVFYAAVMLMILAASGVSGQARFDSYSTDPTYVEAGTDVSIYVKFHEGLVKREIYSTPSSGNVKIPIGEKSDTYYTARIVPKDEATAQYVLVKEGVRDVGHMFAGETWTTPFDVHVDDNAPATNFTLTFQLFVGSISGNATGEVVLTRDIPLEVHGTPKFTIDSDSLLRAGETTKFRVSVGNVGGGTARQVTVNLNATAPLTVLKSSSTYLGDMSGQKSETLTWELYVDSAATPKAYTIPVEIRYTDRDGTAQTSGKALGVKVQGSPQVLVNVDSFDDLKGGMAGKVTLSVANRGFVEAKFLSLSLSDTDQYTVTSKNDVYIGNLASDDFQSEDFKVSVKDGVRGKVPLKAKVEYTEENNNQVHSDEATVYINVLSPDEYEAAHPSANGTQQLLGALVLIPALIVGYLVLWLIFKLVGLLTGLIDRKVFRKQ
jgi:hypothetical protein